VTVSDNHAFVSENLTGNGGGIGTGDIGAPGATLQLAHVTLAGNSARVAATTSRRSPGARV
jgi:hypothetical protein